MYKTFDLKIWLPYIGSFLLCIGIIDTYFYYYLFDINIGDYVSTIEMLSISISNIISSLSLITIFTFCLYFLFNYKDNKRTMEEKRSLIKSYTIIKNNKSILRFIGFITLADIPSYLIFETNNKSFHLYFSIHSIILLIIMFIGMFYEFIGNRKMKLPTTKFTGYIVFIFLLLNLDYTSKKHHNVRHNHLFNGTLIITNNGTIVSNNNIYYIGKTEKYIFINNEKDSSILAIPMSEIKELKIKSK